MLDFTLFAVQFSRTDLATKDRSFWYSSTQSKFLTLNRLTTQYVSFCSDICLLDNSFRYFLTLKAFLMASFCFMRSSNFRIFNFSHSLIRSLSHFLLTVNISSAGGRSLMDFGRGRVSILFARVAWYSHDSREMVDLSEISFHSRPYFL